MKNLKRSILLPDLTEKSDIFKGSWLQCFGCPNKVGTTWTDSSQLILSISSCTIGNKKSEWASERARKTGEGFFLRKPSLEVDQRKSGGVLRQPNLTLFKAQHPQQIKRVKYTEFFVRVSDGHHLFPVNFFHTHQCNCCYHLGNGKQVRHSQKPESFHLWTMNGRNASPSVYLSVPMLVGKYTNFLFWKGIETDFNMFYSVTKNYLEQWKFVP